MPEATKLVLHTTMLKNKVSNVELVRRLGVAESSVRRMCDLLHESKIGPVEAVILATRCQVTAESKKNLKTILLFYEIIYSPTPIRL